MKKNKFQWLLLLALLLVFTACKNDSNVDNLASKSVIAELDDDSTYAFLEMDYPGTILVTAEQTYDAGNEESAAIQCKVYYSDKHGEQYLGSIESLSTAYPISFTKDAIWAGDNTTIRKYIIENGKLVESIDDSNDYEASQVIHFGCGAADCVNSIIEVGN